jgi:hypothetical protein
MQRVSVPDESADVAGVGGSLREDFLDLYRGQAQVNAQYLCDRFAKVR